MAVDCKEKQLSVVHEDFSMCYSTLESYVGVGGEMKEATDLFLQMYPTFWYIFLFQIRTTLSMLVQRALTLAADQRYPKSTKVLKMEKTCEICGAPRPIIYCEADGAFLCLSCDSKVHSANALSSRHTRTLLCDSCRYNQASVRCLDHLMLLCKGCDSRIHRVSSQHKKLMINSFSGCPSAKNFAALWGYGDDELDEFSVRGQDGGGSCVSNQTSGVISRNLGGSVGYTSSSGQRFQEPINNNKEQNNCLIMQQILDLNKLQLTEHNNQSPLRRHYEEHVTPSAVYSRSGNLCGLNQKLKALDRDFNNLQSLDISSNNATSLPQLDHLFGSSYVGDPFSLSKNPVDPNQLWFQNIQDLGVCEELGYSDVFNIPDLDVTFRNFEDLFSGDMSLTESLLGEDLLWSDIEKETKQDVSDSSSVYGNKRENPTYNGEKKFRESMKNNHYLMRSSGMVKKPLLPRKSKADTRKRSKTGV